MGEEYGTDLEKQLLDLQEEFIKLQEGAAEVESCLERRIIELEASVTRLQLLNDQLVMDKVDIQSKLVEKEGEIRYLQNELEASMEKQVASPPTLNAHAKEAQEMFVTIANIRTSLEASRINFV